MKLSSANFQPARFVCRAKSIFPTGRGLVLPNSYRSIRNFLSPLSRLSRTHRDACRCICLVSGPGNLSVSLAPWWDAHHSYAIYTQSKQINHPGCTLEAERSIVLHSPVQPRTFSLRLIFCWVLQTSTTPHVHHFTIPLVHVFTLVIITVPVMSTRCAPACVKFTLYDLFLGTNEDEAINATVKKL